MEAIIFTGLQGSGKSSFYKERFFTTHMRISLDLLRTRNREWQFIKCCFETGQRFVIDNTNPTREERAKYISVAKEAKFRVVGYYLRSTVGECLPRNAERDGAVPDVAILATAKKLEIPSIAEGYDELFYVRLTEDGFAVEDWNNEV